MRQLEAEVLNLQEWSPAAVRAWMTEEFERFHRGELTRLFVGPQWISDEMDAQIEAEYTTGRICRICNRSRRHQPCDCRVQQCPTCRIWFGLQAAEPDLHPCRTRASRRQDHYGRIWLKREEVWIWSGRVTPASHGPGWKEVHDDAMDE